MNNKQCKTSGCDKPAQQDDLFCKECRIDITEFDIMMAKLKIDNDNMNGIKERTLNHDNIVRLVGDPYYRYVNHKDGLATVGFASKEALLRYTNDTFRFDKDSIIIMAQRYKDIV